MVVVVVAEVVRMCDCEFVDEYNNCWNMIVRTRACEEDGMLVACPELVLVLWLVMYVSNTWKNVKTMKLCCMC